MGHYNLGRGSLAIESSFIQVIVSQNKMQLGPGFMPIKV